MFKGMKRIASGINPLHAGLMGPSSAALGSALQGKLQGQLMRPKISQETYNDDTPLSAYDPGMQVLGLQNGSKGGMSAFQGGPQGDSKMSGMQSALGGFGGLVPQSQGPNMNPMQSAVRRMRVMSKGGF